MSAAIATSRAEQKQDTRARILETACALFARQGITATPTLEVADAAEVAHGTVFLHFPTRDALVTAVVEEYAGRIAWRIHRLAPQEPALRGVLEAHLASLSEQEEFYARLVMEGPLLPSYARTRLIIIQSAVAHYFALAAEREMDAGRIRRAPVGLLFNTWLGLLHHYVCNRDLFAPGASVLERRGPALLEHFLSLVEVPR
jgi:AcrR family transcriptional regulator